MIRILSLLATATVISFAGFAETAPSTSSLTVNLSGLSPQTGAVMIGVYAGEDDYENGGGITGATVEITADTATVTIEGLEPGAYGLKMYHDSNGNGQMDTNPFGMPTEPYAFSNNAKGRFGPAEWDSAAFQVTAGDNSHDIAFD
ncbi:MAG: DUF2141 domain-containing protein [Pseudomonadota bacterium]